MSVWEHYAQDESTVEINHRRRGDYRLSCDCGWAGRAEGETQANNVAMSHVLDHDIAYEEQAAVGGSAEEPQE